MATSPSLRNLINAMKWRLMVFLASSRIVPPRFNRILMASELRKFTVAPTICEDYDLPMHTK